MQVSFWQQRWQENKIGFHLDEVNPLLIKYSGEMRLAPGEQVFVPLCGKSQDLIWLTEQGFRVFGIELSELAVEAFFAENNLSPFKQQKGDLTHYQAGLITLVCGDFFALMKEQMVNIAAVYDRAALIAMPENLRVAYSQHLNAICPHQSRLLITLEYEQSQMDGPPFSVLEKELDSEYANQFNKTCLQRTSVLTEHAHFKAKGLSQLDESVYILHRE